MLKWNSYLKHDVPSGIVCGKVGDLTFARFFVPSRKPQGEGGSPGFPQGGNLDGRAADAPRRESGFSPGDFLGEGAARPLFPRGETGGFPGDFLGNGRSAQRLPSEKLEDFLTLRRQSRKSGKVQMAPNRSHRWKDHFRTS